MRANDHQIKSAFRELVQDLFNHDTPPDTWGDFSYHPS